jgi:hypothetical protein
MTMLSMHDDSGMIRGMYLRCRACSSSQATRLRWWISLLLSANVGCLLPSVTYVTEDSGAAVDDAGASRTAVEADSSAAPAIPTMSLPSDAMVEAPRETCDATEEGALRCAPFGMRERCMAMLWVAEAPCDSGAACLMEPSSRAGTCATCAPASFRCDDAALLRCTEDGLSWDTIEHCKSKPSCDAKAGACTVCSPGEALCQGSILRKCASDGSAFSDTSCGSRICNSVARRCDMCKLDETKCRGDVVLSCDSTGQHYNERSCGPTLNRCLAGRCVECISEADCSQYRSSAPCSSSACSSTHWCDQHLPDGTRCTDGSITGTCVGGRCQSSS